MTEIFSHYVEILSDPAHSLVEFTFVLFDVLIIDSVRRRWNKRLDRRIAEEHVRLDAEHGVTHHEPKHRANTEES